MHRIVAGIGVACTVSMMLFVGSVGGAAATEATPNGATRAVQEGGDGSDGIIEHTCDGCEPPLEYQGGPVMDTTGPAGVTITPIFWAPKGYAFPDGYEDLIVRYLEDVAADSGKTTNVYSLAPEYSVTKGDDPQELRYLLSAGETIVDEGEFPASDCDVDDGFRICITDTQVRAELRRLIDDKDLALGLANMYPVFLPPGVETEDLDGTNSVDAFCGYHRAFDHAGDVVIYGNEPFEEDGCGQGQSPNGNLAADGAISVLSHEIMEALTDPTDVITWNDKTGHEIGDICAEFFGPPLGVADESDPDTTAYNQMINGNRYYTQTEFSNAAFKAFGDGAGCQQSADSAAAAIDSPIGVMLATANPNVADADGKTTTDIELSITAPDGSSLAGDHLAYSTKVIDGRGTCGDLSKESATTDKDGFAKITYTASTDDVVCGVVISDSIGGQSSTAVIYQGTTASRAPTAKASFPTALTPGADASTFDVTFANPGDDDFTSAQISFSIFPADGSTTDITSDQVALSASFDDADGPFEPVELTGSTGADGSITGYLEDVAIDAGDETTVTFKMAVDDTVATAPDPAVSFEAYLNVINPANGAGTNLADTLASDVTLSPASDGAPLVPIVIIALFVLVITGVGVFRARRQTGPMT